MIIYAYFTIFKAIYESIIVRVLFIKTFVSPDIYLKSISQKILYKNNKNRLK